MSENRPLETEPASNIRTPTYGDSVIDTRIASFFQENRSGQIYLRLCRETALPPIIDHITFRCMNIDRRAEVFLEKGYRVDEPWVEYPDQGWWAKVYRKPGFPTLFIDQAYDDERGAKSLIPGWVKQFGEELLHHVAVRVNDIEKTIEALRNRGVLFAGDVVGEPKTRLRQIFTAAEVRQGVPFSVLELTERNGYDGFIPESANRLMASSVVTQPTS